MVAQNNPREAEAVEQWWTKAFASAAPGGAAQAPVSFRYGEGNSEALLPNWSAIWGPECRGASTRHLSLCLRDPATGLECRLEITRFDDFPAVEWVAHFVNTGPADTPILADIQALDGLFAPGKDKGCRVHHAKGSECRFDDFAPLETWLGPCALAPQEPKLGPGNPLRLASKLGRSSCGAMPFFNVDMEDRGVIGAVGWTGDWTASFWREAGGEVHVRAGMQRTHLRLRPGEQIRTPRILLLFWEGERMRGHNLLRQLILAHYTPRPAGKLLEAPICNTTWGGNFAEKHIEHARWWKDNDLPMDYLWVDAGWFGNDEAKAGATVFNSAWWRYVGDWQPNPGFFPNGLKPVGEAIKQLGLKLLLWVEPERVFKGTSWTREYPQWLLGPIGGNQLFNLGIAEARQALTEQLSNLIEEGNIGCYRQDFNTDPAPFWQAADVPDRVGISEIRHIEGLYVMWDELLRRHPGLIIDNCSSGGRRIDLETISRSIPLWRSDVQCYPGFGVTAMQAQTHGLGLWTPLSVGVCDRQDTYLFRSALGPGMNLIMYEFENDVSRHFDVDWLRQRLGEVVALRKCFLGDFHPLVSFSLGDDAWAAWQFDRPDLGEGMILCLRRPKSPFPKLEARLCGLDPEARYELQSMDTAAACLKTGRELMDEGLIVEIPERPGSAIWIYRRIP